LFLKMMPQHLSPRLSPAPAAAAVDFSHLIPLPQSLPQSPSTASVSSFQNQNSDVSLHRHSTGTQTPFTVTSTPSRTPTPEFPMLSPDMTANLTASVGSLDLFNPTHGREGNVSNPPSRLSGVSPLSGGVLSPRRLHSPLPELQGHPNADDLRAAFVPSSEGASSPRALPKKDDGNSKRA
jgi:hypothetical protein